LVYGTKLKTREQMRKVLKNLIKSDIIKVLISIITDIAYENPRTYPHTSAILSKL